MSLFGKDFLKEGADSGKGDFEGGSQFYFDQYAGEGNYGGLGAQGYGLQSGYPGGPSHQLPQQSRLGGQPLFNRTANPQAAPNARTAVAAPGLGPGILGMGSNNSTANNTPGRGAIGAASSLAGLSSDTARFGGASAGQGLGALRGLGGGAFGGAAAEDDLMGNVMSNIAGLNDGSDELGSNGSSLFGSSAEASSLLGSRPSASSSLLGAPGSIGPTGGDLLSNMSQSGGFLSGISSSSSTTGLTSLAPSKDSKFGLVGLLNDVLRASDKDSQQLSLGTDLTTFGLNLSASENLYPTFISPFTENMLDEKPYKVPACYLAPTAILKAEHITKFQVETLFYMFYLMPKDVFQSLAALELYRREWRYHGELKVWLKQRTQQEMLQAHPQVQFVYFDPKSFEARLFNAAGRGNLSAGIVSEDEIRARISPAALASVTSGNAAAAQQTTPALGGGSGMTSLPGMLGQSTGGLTLGGDSSS